MNTELSHININFCFWQFNNGSDFENIKFRRKEVLFVYWEGFWKSSVIKFIKLKRLMSVEQFIRPITTLINVLMQQLL